MTTAARNGDRPSAGDPIGPGLIGTLRSSWKTGSGRRQLWLLAGAAALLLVVVAIAVTVVAFGSLGSESASYRNGDTVGGSVYASDSSESNAQTACTAAEHDPVGVDGMPKGNVPSQWVKGCEAGFAAAQSGS
jgi:hypothetical protein